MTPRRRVTDHPSWTIAGFLLIGASIALLAFRLVGEWPALAFAALGGILVRGESVVAGLRAWQRHPPPDDAE